ncbi:MAG: 4-hydroxybenzoate octaprenyltransferase [Pseudomonadota bacterium]
MTSRDRPNLTAPDAALPDTAGNWADRLPPAWRPFARLARWDRPIGWQLLLWPCCWSVMLAVPTLQAAGALPEPARIVWHLVLFMVGAIAMRGAGCTYNDIVDRDLDAKVTRTAARPLASGQVSVRAALAFAGAQALTGLLVVLQFDAFTIALSLASLLVVAAYPFAKRVTNWPQSVLGLAFSWGALVGWASLVGGLSAAPLLLFAGAVLWVIGYDTIYAHQDREDDAMIGIGSTALRFGRATPRWLAGFYGGAVFLIGAAFALAGIGWIGFAGLAAFALLLARQVRRLDIDDPALCLALFKANHPAGAVLFAGLVADALM